MIFVIFVFYISSESCRQGKRRLMWLESLTHVCIRLSENSFNCKHIISRGSNRRGKLGGLALKQGCMWENVHEFPQTKRPKVPAIYF